MTIEIITTPNETLKETGFGTMNASKSILKSIQAMYHTGRINNCTTITDLEKIVKRKPDLVILAVKYIVRKNEPNIWLCDYFNKHNINYTGSSKDILKFDSNKVLAKALLKRKGIRTADYFVAIPKEYTKNTLPLNFPLFLKPIDAANGNGIDDFSFVNNFKEYEAKLLCLFNLYQQPILVEQFLDGKEFTVAVLQKKRRYIKHKCH
jgi:D-alanine-D-alanine ligase